jgi:hypothetical protein
MTQRPPRKPLYAPDPLIDAFVEYVMSKRPPPTPDQMRKLRAMLPRPALTDPITTTDPAPNPATTTTTSTTRRPRKATS